MMVGLLVRRALVGAALAAAGAAGSYLVKRYVERRQAGARRDDPEMMRWEGEGGSPPELRSAAPDQQVTAS